MIFPWLLALLSFVIVLAVIPGARALALKYEFVDAPGGRKQHDDPVPPIGGLVIFPVFMLLSIAAGVDVQSYWPLYLGLAILLFTGAVDDLEHINAWAKFFVQIAVAALVVIAGQARLYALGDLFGFGNIGLGWMSIPFSMAAVVLLINAVNLMDGLDGLAAGKGFVVLFWLVLACFLAGEPAAAAVMMVLLGALAGFLFYNMRHPLRGKACIFLGDAGSLCLGLVLAWFCIGLAQEPDPILVPISVAWILALPIIDACGQFFRRVREGRHPFSPDRGHFHHHFIHAGIPVGRATPMILGVGVVLGAVGVLGITLGVPQPVLTVLWIALLFSHMALSQKPESYTRCIDRLLKSGRRNQDVHN